MKYIGKPLVIILESVTAAIQAGDTVDPELEDYLREFYPDSLVSNGSDPFFREPDSFFNESIAEESVSDSFEPEIKNHSINQEEETNKLLLLELQNVSESLNILKSTVDMLSEKIEVLEKQKSEIELPKEKDMSLWKALTNKFFLIDEKSFYIENAETGLMLGGIFRFSRDEISWSYGLCSKFKQSDRQTYVECIGSPLFKDVKTIEFGDSSLVTWFTEVLKKEQPFIHVWQGPQSRLINIYFYPGTVLPPEVCGAEINISGKPISIDSPTIDLGKKVVNSGVNINGDCNLVSFGDRISIDFLGDAWDFQEIKVGFTLVRETNA